jgi:hypothetical protein
MEFGHVDIPMDIVTESLEELRSEVEEVMKWFETSTRSLDLIQTASERQLTKEEASIVARDFLAAGIFLGNMTHRNHHIAQTGMSHVARESKDDLIANFEKFLKGTES